MARKKSHTVAGCKKAGRSKRRADAKISALSKYVRGLITFEQYVKSKGVRKGS